MLKQVILTYRRVYPNRCFYCGADMVKVKNGMPYRNVDHVVPKAKGGTNKASNRAPCCRKCNTSKLSLSLNEFREKFGKPFFYETVIEELTKKAEEMENNSSLTARVEPQHGSNPLTPGMIEMIMSAGDGETNQELASRLGTSEQTIKNRWVLICELIGAVNKANAIYLATKNGWV